LQHQITPGGYTHCMSYSSHVTPGPQLIKRFQEQMEDHGAQWAGTAKRPVHERPGARLITMLAVHADPELDLGLNLDGTFEGHQVLRQGEIVEQ
jgi:hypothetical protein